MTLNVTKEVTRLRKMTVGELRERFAEVTGENTQGRQPQMVGSPNHLADAESSKKAACPNGRSLVPVNWPTVPICGSLRRDNVACRRTPTNGPRSCRVPTRRHQAGRYRAH